MATKTVEFKDVVAWGAATESTEGAFCATVEWEPVTGGDLGADYRRWEIPRLDPFTTREEAVEAAYSWIQDEGHQLQMTLSTDLR